MCCSLCSASIKDALKIVPLRSSDPIMEGSMGRFRREARARRDKSTSRCETAQKRLTSIGRIEKHMHNLSDEALCARWLENPYYQYFCGEESFCHKLPFDRSSLTRWRQRLGEEQLVALIQESLSVAHNTGAIASRDLERVAVDTTVQPKAIAHPTDARLLHRALVKPVGLAKRYGVPLRQSYLR